MILLKITSRFKRNTKPQTIPLSEQPAVYGVEGMPYLGAELRNPHIDSKWNWEDYIMDNVNPKHVENHNASGERRGVSAQSAYYNVFGVPRTGFDQHSIDIIRKNPYYLLMETAFCNYLRSITFDIKDEHGEHVDYAYDLLRYPNPQQGFWDVWIPCIRDTLAYDAGVIVKTFTRSGYLAEMHAYPGPQFWAELDRTFFDDAGEQLPNFGGAASTFISHGYVVRWWQHTSIGLFIPYKPEEIMYLMQYPQSGSVYGSDILRYFRYHYRYLMSSTVSAGKIMDNGLVTNLVFKHPDIGTIQTLKQRLDATKQVNTGSDNFGKTLHLIGNEDVTTVSNTLMDMEWLNGQQFVFRIVMNLFGFPASEFSMESGGGMSRSSAYVQRNIMRTRMLATILSLLEEKINHEILPYIKGFNKNWVFSFQRSVDLDDLIKETHITNERASSFSIFVNEGVPALLALKLAGLGKELTPEERDMLSDELHAAAEATDGATAHGDRYDGDDYNETFMGYQEKNAVTNSIRAAKTYNKEALW